jgi:hypothetical protein
MHLVVSWCVGVSEWVWLLERVKFFGVFAWLIEGSRPQCIGKKKFKKKCKNVWYEKNKKVI